MDTETDKDVAVRPSTDAENAADERRIISAAIARGYQVTRWIAMIIGLLFIASGLWWAGILVVTVTTFDLPRRATQRYARKHGVELDVPSSNEIEKTSLSGLFFGIVFIPAVGGFMVAEAKLGHPLLPWSWSPGQYHEDDLYLMVPLVFVGLVVTIAWFVRRRRHNRRHEGDVNR